MAGTAADIVLEEARRALDEQQAALADVRSRAGVVFTVAGLTSSFLAGPALNGHKGMPWLGWLALAFLLLSAGAAVAVLWPRCKFRFTISPSTMLEPSWMHLDPDEVRKRLAGYAGEATDDNDTALNRLWWGVRVALILALASIGAWVALLAKGPLKTKLPRPHRPHRRIRSGLSHGVAARSPTRSNPTTVGGGSCHGRATDGQPRDR